MSHFTVMVIGDDVEKQMAPFQENNMGDCPKEYLKFLEAPEDEQEYYDEKDPETGKFGYWENPNAKWDWFQTGGRWAGSLMLTENAIEAARTGEDFHPEIPNFSWGWNAEEKAKVLAKPCVDIAPKKYIDIGSMEKPMIEKASRQWDGWNAGVKDLPEDNDERKKWVKDNLGWFVSKLDIDRLSTMSRGEYIDCKSCWSPYAMVWDGKWYAKGEMGWFAISTKEESDWKGQFKELWKEIPDTEIVTMVDCHI